MKQLQIALVAVIAAMAVPAKAAEENDAFKKELAQLQGEWRMVSGTTDGQQMSEPLLKQMKRVCKGDELTVTMSGQIYFKAKITLDPSKNPKTIDYQMTEGFPKGNKQLGIYEVHGDTFKSSFGKPGGERPSDFSSKAGDGRTVTTWKREKAGDSSVASPGK